MAHRHPHERVVETVIVEEVIDDDGDDNYEDEDDDTGAVIEELDEAQSARTRADREGVPLGKDGRPEPPAEEEEEPEDDIDRDDFDPDKETLAERLYALKDVIPVYRRRQVQRVVSTVSDVGRSLFKLGGAVAWVVATSVLVVVIPLGIELEYDQQAAAWEAEALAQQQQAKQLLDAPAA